MAWHWLGLGAIDAQRLSAVWAGFGGNGGAEVFGRRNLCALSFCVVCAPGAVWAGFGANPPRVWKPLTRFPPNSGDLNPIETVWARLRRDLSIREREDLKAGRTLSTGQFKMRVSQLLTSYSERKVGERFNYYERLLRGMPARLAKCRANKFGPCGK